MKRKRLRGRPGGVLRTVREKNIPDNGNGVNKCPGARKSMVCLRNREELRVVRLLNTWGSIRLKSEKLSIPP